MRSTILAAFTLFAAQQPPDDAKAIQGHWRCVGLNIDGEKVKLSVASRIRLKVDGSAYMENALGKELQKLTYRLLPGGLVRFEVPGAYSPRKPVTMRLSGGSRSGERAPGNVHPPSHAMGPS